MQPLKSAPIDSEKGTVLETLLILVVVLGVVGGLVVLNLRGNLGVQMPTPTIPPNLHQVSVPADAIKISGCIPFEGEHLVRVEDLPHGPFYVAHEGKVIAIEYMFEPKEIPGEDLVKMPPQEFGAYMQKQQLSVADLVEQLHFGFDLFGNEYKDFNFNWAPPHAGLVAPHYDIHFYLVDESERAKICPDAQIQDIAPPELLKRLSELGVPLPPAPEGAPPQQ